MEKGIIKQGYNRAASRYLAERNKLKSAKYVQKLLKLLKKNSLVLDLGCGDGSGVDEILLKAGHEVVGIDISEEMIKRARKNHPGASYVVGDMEELKEGEYQVETVVSFYALFHIARSKQEAMLKKINSFLPKEGLLLITMGDKEFEGTTNFYGQPMWWSQWGTKKNLELVKAAGFEILLDEIDVSGSEKHQVIMARKI